MPPGLELLASPALLMVAIPVTDEFQTAALVRFCVVPSVKCRWLCIAAKYPPEWMTMAGVTAIETKAGGATLAVVEPHSDPAHALIIAVPGARQKLCRN